MNIYDILKKYNLDFLALTETKINIKNAKFMAKEIGINEEYIIQGTIDNNKQNSTGVIVFIKKQIANNISDVQVQLGRIIKIDFEFSKYNKLSIISIYNKSGNCKQAREEQQTINQLVINMIKTSRRNQQQIIILGDFNLNYGKYEKLRNRNVRIDNQFNIFKYLENHDFIDAHKNLLDIDDQQLEERYSSFKNYATFSRIDYIWISGNLDNALINAKIIQNEYNDTDHKLLIVKLDRKELLPQSVLKKTKIPSYRIKYSYDKLTDEKKEQIRESAKAELNNRIEQFTPNNIEEKWNIYNHVISTVKKKGIEHTEIKVITEKPDEELKTSMVYKFYRFIVYLRRCVKKKRKLSLLKEKWKIIVKNLQKMLDSLDIGGDFYLTSYNFSKLLYMIYIKKAEELFKFDKKRMIDNVMEREFKKIHIDRVITKDEEGDDILITDENEIKKIVAEHFQNCAGSINRIKEIPQDWIDEYQPKDEISSSIYDSVLKPISIEELLETAKMLPGEKATGLTGIPRSIIFPGCAYMDDTGFIANNKRNLEKILEIADSFYRLNDIKINKQKSELLLRKNINKKNPLDKKVRIIFGLDTIEVEPTTRDQSSRFLGVWINAYNDNKHVKQQIKNEIKAIIKNLSSKKGITDKMMIYLFNALIISIVEYRSQLYVIEDVSLDKLMAPFRMFIKNKLKFAKTASNAILETNFIYNLNNFVANQKQAKITNFTLQINDKGVLGMIMKIRFMDLQRQLLLENHPLYIIDDKVLQIIKRINKKKYIGHFIVNNIKLMIENNFNILKNDKILSDFSIEGGPTALRDILSIEVYTANFKFFKDNNIIFLDQITTLDNRYILSIEELESRSFIKLNKKKKLQKYTKFYHEIIEEMTYSKATYSIKSEKLANMVELDDDICNMKGTILITAETKPNKGATIISKLSRGVYQNRIVFGKIVELDLDNKLAFSNHFENISMEKEKNLVLKKCGGCEIGIQNASIFKDKAKTKCLIIERMDNTFLISANRWNGHNHNKALGNNTYFYEDGSVRNQGTENINSIFGVMIYDENNNLIDKYFSTIEQWITSIKAETMAFFTALLMIPPGKKCTVYTDCQNIVNNFNLLTSDIVVTTTRDILKFSNNNAIWFNIKELLEDQTLDVKIVKVNAHSDDVLHNQVDKEIKDSYELDYSLTNTLVIYNAEQYKFPLVWNGHLIEMNIRHFVRLITRIEGLEKFLNLNRNKRYRFLDKCIDKLRMLLIEKGVKNITTEEIINLDVFGNRFTNEKFNFVDLIKGIFPSQLYEFILGKLGGNQKNNAIDIGTCLLQYIFEETKKQVWEPRCNLLAQLEKNYEITKQDKRKQDSLFLEEKKEEITNRPNCFDRRYRFLEGVREYILFGKEILGFTVVVNRWSFAIFILLFYFNFGYRW
ncbi:17183_t:CDS:2 [Rhizophagus irregularis]|nr:17183_t:CDS:2 [Rhizophagus irregularis]